MNSLSLRCPNCGKFYNVTARVNPRFEEVLGDD